MIYFADTEKEGNKIKYFIYGEVPESEFYTVNTDQPNHQYFIHIDGFEYYGNKWRRMKDDKASVRQTAIFKDKSIAQQEAIRLILFED